VVKVTKYDMLKPMRRHERTQRKTDWWLYKERHLLENLFLKLKNYRRFATRYEKLASSFYSVSYLSCILLWLF